MKLTQKISKDLNIPMPMIDEALNSARKLVKHIKMAKRDGNTRTVMQPSKKLKVIQYWLLENVLSKMNIHDSATAYRENFSIKENAKIHAKQRYFLKLDFKDFFPSIKYNDLKPFIISWHKSVDPEWDLDGNAERVFKQACFYRNNRLPIGYPPSPIISNIVMYNFDVLLVSAFSDDKETFGDVTYTRYADDMVFSIDKKGACKEIHTFVKSVVKDLKSPKLMLNREKTRYVSSSGGSALITGLRICNDGHITLHRSYKDKIRLLVSLYSKGRLSKDDEPRLQGHLAHVRHVDPVFFTRLQKKYFKAIERIKNINK